MGRWRDAVVRQQRREQRRRAALAIVRSGLGWRQLFRAWTRWRELVQTVRWLVDLVGWLVSLAWLGLEWLFGWVGMGWLVS